MPRDRTRAILRLSAVVVLVAAACSEGATGPLTPGVEVALHAYPFSPRRIEGGGENTHIICEVGIEATAHGRVKAGWTGATFEFFVGLDRTAAVDTFQLTREEVVSSFRRDSLSAARPDTSFWTFAAAVPFNIRTRFHYGTPVSLERRSAILDYLCGPELPENATMPAITLVEVSGSDDVIEVGDTIRVRYAYTAAASAWRSVAAMRGPFEEFRFFADSLAGARDRTVEFVVPRLAQLGMPIRAEVQVMDGAARIVDTVVTSTQVVSDVTRPSIFSLYAPDADWGTGESIPIAATAFDNHDLQWMHYELDAPIGHRDSVRVTEERPTHEQAMYIEVRPEWAGQSVGVKVWMRDAAGLSSDTLSSVPGAFRFYPSFERVPSALGHWSDDPAPGLEAAQLLLDEANDRLHIRLPGVRRLASFDLGSFTRLPTVQLESTPFSMDLSVSGDSLLVPTPHSRAIQVVELASRQLLAPISVMALLDSAGGTQADLVPVGVRVSAAGRALVQLNTWSPSGDRLMEVDLGSGSQRIRTETRHPGLVNGFFSRLGSTPDGSRIFVLDDVCASVYVSATDSFGTCQAENPRSGVGWTFDAALTRMAVGGLLLGTDLSPIAELPHENIALAQDGLSYFRAIGNSIARVRIADGMHLYRVMLPFAPYRLVLLADGRTMLAVAFQGAIARIDAGPP